MNAYESHKGAVKDICFDEEAETVGSCSDDGTVVVRGVFSDEYNKIHYNRPLTVCFDTKAAIGRFLGFGD